jgi:hypothetical protein
MDTLAGVIIGPVLIAYGLFVYHGKMLWFLTYNKERFKDESDESRRKQAYRIYGIIFVAIGIIISMVGVILYIKGIETTKSSYLY